LRTSSIYIYIYIYIEREREREISTTADPTNKPIGNPKSSSVAKGRQGFPLHASGFEPRTSFEVIGSQTWAISLR